MTRTSQSPGRPPRLHLHRVVVALVAMAVVATGVPLDTQVAAADESTDLVSLVNRDRAANGLPSLVSNAQLNAVAKRWAERMAAENRMYHNPSLSSQVPSGWQRLGENVATGHRSPAEMQQAWMNSSGHRANILGSFNSVGTAFVRVNGKTWGVQVFATYPGVVAGPSEGVKAISAAWADAGGKSGAWGNRLDAPACAGASACGHVFEKVIAYWQSGKGVTLAAGSIAQWARSQGVTTTGYPNSQPVSVSKNGGGTAQSFTKVLVNAGPSGIFALSGAIRDAHGKAGGVGGALGWPTGAQTCGLTNGGCSQTFQNATMYLAGGVARFVATGAVATFYQSNGGPAGSLGYPTSDSIPVAANGGGTAQAFTGGLVNAGPAGAFLMTGAIRDAHGKAGGVGGSLGWPTGAQTCGLPNGGCSQTFQKGTISVNAAGVATISR